MKSFVSITLIGMIMLWAACANKPTTTETQSDLIEITQDQFEAAQMELGQIKRSTFNKTIHVNGKVTALPSNCAVLSMPIACSIVEVKCAAGQMVTKGQTLFTVGGHALIELQEDYAQAAAQLMRLKAEYDRVLVLYNDKVATAKELMVAESAYKAQLAGFSSYKLKVASLGLNPSSIENGDFVTQVPVVAPIKGSISTINVSIGQYIEPHVFLADIVNREDLVVKLAVFEKDLQQLAVGQLVNLRFIGNPETFPAKLITINHSVDPVERVVDGYAKLTNPANVMLVNNQFAEADIIIDTVMTTAIPLQALLKIDTTYFMFRLAKKSSNTYFFNKIPVKIGIVQKGLAQLLTIPESGEVLLNGAYSMSFE